MQWLFIVWLTRADMLISGPTPAEMESVGKHFQYWADLTQKEVALVVGRTQTTDPGTMGIAIFRAEDRAKAEQIAEQDPAVVDGVFKHELMPYQVALLGNPAPFQPTN